MTTLSVIGGGRVGRTLGKLWHDNEALQIQDVVCRSLESAEAAVDVIGSGVPLDDWSKIRPADIFLLSIPDDALTNTVTTLAAHLNLENIILFHTSGWMTSDKLRIAPGVHAASVHPIKGIADPAIAAETFAGTPCGVEGDERALTVLRPLFEGIGASLLDIDPRQKPLYHTATVIGCNYVVALTQLAQDALVAVGVDKQQALELLIPLLRGTVNNLENLGPVDALTGPIARGDASTIAAHLDALRAWKPQNAHTYADLAKHTMAIAAEQGTSADQLAAIDKLL